MNSQLMTKTTRPIGVKVLNMPVKEFYIFFHKLSYWQAQIMNLKMNELYTQAKGWKDWKPEESTFIETKRIVQNSYIRVMANQEARKKWDSTTRKQVLRGDISLPTFKNKRLIIGNGGFKLLRENDNFYIDIRLTDKNKDYTRLILLGLNKMQWKSPGQFICLERIFSGEYKSKTAQLIQNGKYIYIRFPYTFTPEDRTKPIASRIMGVDLGIKTPAVCAFNDSFKREYFQTEGIRLLKVKSDTIGRYRKIQRQITQNGNREGRGKEYKLAPLVRIQGIWDNFRTTFNHQLSKKIIDFAVKNQVALIQIEDLTNGNKENSLLGRRWPIGQLLFSVEYKAKEVGIKTKKINPRYTSQRCSRCGFINKNFNFKERAKKKFPDFECLDCGVRLPADYNAAKNIATKDIEEIITKIKADTNQQKLENSSLIDRVEENTVEVVPLG